MPRIYAANINDCSRYVYLKLTACSQNDHFSEKIGLAARAFLLLTAYSLQKKFARHLWQTMFAGHSQQAMSAGHSPETLFAENSQDVQFSEKLAAAFAAYSQQEKFAACSQHIRCTFTAEKLAALSRQDFPYMHNVCVNTDIFIDNETHGMQGVKYFKAQSRFKAVCESLLYSYSRLSMTQYLELGYLEF